MNILALLQPIADILPKTTFCQMSRVITAMLSITGRVTMLGLSRWTEKGGSYRTIQRFYGNVIPWMEIQWLFFQSQFLKSGQEYILAGDETVVSKAGKQTHGLDRFFSGIYQRVIPSIAFFSLSLINTEEGRSYPIQMSQIIKTEEEKAANRRKAESRKERENSTEKRKRGRPKGSKNKQNQEKERSPELTRIQASLRSVLTTIGKTIVLKYIALDGHFGNYPSAKMVKELGLEIVSKMRSDASLFLEFAGKQNKHGRKRIYGERLDLSYFPPCMLKTTTIVGKIRTEIYQGKLLNKNFPYPLNVVIIVKTNLTNQKQAHVVLFSTDLALDYERLIRFYSLRFQIEFNFRDAKQHWGLEDFMNVKETAVTNAANLSLFMVNVSYTLIQPFRECQPDYGVLDLKSHFRGMRYASEIINILPQKPDNILLHQIFEQLTLLGAIHPVVFQPSSP
jgi:putative transposase